ncbi:MAG: hypothetical protein JXB88_21030 [Spirochaetales bacterium]|nr:hypothetical protein [Spirochaetales bacterium]
MTRKYLIFLVILLISISFSVHAQVVVLYKCGEPTLESSIIRPHINIVNRGDTGIALNDIVVRYFYTNEGLTPERFQIDYAVLGGSRIMINLEYGYAEISFPGVDMIIPPGGGETGEIQIKINRSDWTNYDQRDDFSFNPTFTAFKESPRIALYYQGTLIWGTEHFINPSPTPPVPIQ